MRRWEDMSDFEVMIEKERTRIFKEILERCDHKLDIIEISIVDLYVICTNRKEIKVGK